MHGYFFAKLCEKSLYDVRLLCYIMFTTQEDDWICRTEQGKEPTPIKSY